MLTFESPQPPCCSILTQDTYQVLDIYFLHFTTELAQGAFEMVRLYLYYCYIVTLLHQLLWIPNVLPQRCPVPSNSSISEHLRCPLRHQLAWCRAVTGVVAVTDKLRYSYHSPVSDAENFY